MRFWKVSQVAQAEIGFSEQGIGVADADTVSLFVATDYNAQHNAGLDVKNWLDKNTVFCAFYGSWTQTDAFCIDFLTHLQHTRTASLAYNSQIHGLNHTLGLHKRKKNCKNKNLKTFTFNSIQRILKHLELWYSV